MSRRILFVGMQSSIHVARGIELVCRRPGALNVFPLNDYDPTPNLRAVNVHWPTLAPMPAYTVPEAEQKSEPSSDLPVADRIIRFAGLMASDPDEALRRIRNRWPWPSSVGPPKPLTTTPWYASADELGVSGLDGSGTIRLGESDAAAPALYGPGVRAALVRRLKPDLIHSMEFQHAGYLVLRARELYGAGFPPWLATNWGSDIFYFSRFADPHAQIKRLLATIDFYSCECKRDLALARQLGYRGRAFSSIPNSGGFDLAHVMSLRSGEPPSRRKLLMIKGYEHFAGRAMTALRVLETFSEQLKSYRVVLFSPSEQPWKRALELKERGVLDIEVLTATPHDEILARFGRSRIYMGISISDAISTSALEAMAMGAFPIQTNTSCCDEWFQDEEGGFLVPPDNYDVICDRFHRALTDDALVDRAAEATWKTG